MLDGLVRLDRLGSTPKRLSFMGPSGVDLGMTRHQTKGYPFTNSVKILMLDGLGRAAWVPPPKGLSFNICLGRWSGPRK